MITQIYSIQTAEEALACIDAGADRIGLLVGVHGGKFPCAITQEKAKEIFKFFLDSDTYYDDLDKAGMGFGKIDVKNL